jgi:hypothetical protein
MKSFWKKFAEIAAKAAIWAAGHPDVVIGIVNDVKNAEK